MRLLPIARTLLALALITIVADPPSPGRRSSASPTIGTARSLPWDARGSLEGHARRLSRVTAHR